MCGIFFTNMQHNDNIGNFNKIIHRGPDGKKMYQENDHYYGFHRLSIINPKLGINQPFFNDGIITLCNGEIYNWQELSKEYGIEVETDCEIIPHLYIKLGRDFVKLVQLLDGEFAIILHDKVQNKIYAARDLFGIRPLFYSYENGKIELASELKALVCRAKHIEPRQIYTFNDNKELSIVPYWNFPKQQSLRNIPVDTIYDDLYQLLFKSVESRTHSDRPIGCLLSGGLDSSLITALVSKICPHIQCFVIGAPDSTDVIAAQKVADFLKVPLQVVNFDRNEALVAIPNVINSLETYDITTIRASTPQWFLAHWISKNTDIKVVLSGEGSDELFANGYAYTKLYDDAQELWHEGERLLSELHLFDCLRTDRSMASAGLEVRVPFLQKNIIEYVRNLDPELLLYSPIGILNLDRSIEKAILRGMAAKYKLLPSEVIWRPKEAFSDAVGFSWKDAIEQHTANQKILEYKHLTPISEEAQWYREIFDNKFPNQEKILSHYWLPKKFKTNDPSARALQFA